MRLARLVTAPAAQRPPDARVHGEHRGEVDDRGMREDLEAVLQFVGEQRNQPVVIDPRAITGHDNAKVTSSGRGYDKGQQTPVQVAERAITELDIDNAVPL